MGGGGCVCALPWENGKVGKEGQERVIAHLGFPVISLSVKAGAGATKKLIDLAG